MPESELTTEAQALPLIVAHPRFTLPAALNGCDGYLRRREGLRLMAADNDYDAVTQWLSRYTDSPRTLHSYRGHIERLLLWATNVRRKPLSSLLLEDYQAYREWLKAPPADWVMEGARRPRIHPEWRPLAGPLSTTSLTQTFRIIGACLSWLEKKRYLADNPLAGEQIAGSSQRRMDRTHRYIHDDDWAMLQGFVASLPTESAREKALQARLRWIAHCAFLTGLRISELAQAKMGDIEYRRRGSHESWWIEVRGKGDKQRLVPLSDDFLEELRAYREHLGLSPRPVRGESQPLISRLGNAATPIKVQRLHGLIKYLFEQTADVLEREGEPNRASAVRQASMHWLRHTFAKNALEAMTPVEVQKMMGHADLTTLSIYADAEDERLYDHARHSIKKNRES